MPNNSEKGSPRFNDLQWTLPQDTLSSRLRRSAEVFFREFKSPTANISLRDVLTDQPFKVIEKPFRHIIVDDLFIPSYYEALCRNFQMRLRLEFSDQFLKGAWCRMGKYDAYCYNFDPRESAPLNVFHSAEWDNLISGIFGFVSSKDTTAVLHHHKTGGADGWIHNDFIKVAFVEDRLPNGINAFHNQCLHENSSPGIELGTFRRMRAVAIIYFLNNKVDWKEGDGGETGLYATREADSLVKKVAPLNNRLLAHEISPASWHRFIKNNTFDRNSVIEWLHQKPEDMYARHGTADEGRWESR